mmetsp:Transcript_38979/g.90020  ORF Transcript_38979/g.90020 Transcript_38979/m.90020 type:complete len:136 (-) Transcript_38979:148-555(-)
METLQQSISTTDTDLQGMSSRMAAMQQSMSTIQGPNPPAWFVMLIFNFFNKERSFDPLWIHGANIIRNNLTPFARYSWAKATVEMDGTQSFLRLPAIANERIRLEHGAVSCQQFPNAPGHYVIATVTAWPVVPEF